MHQLFALLLYSSASRAEGVQLLPKGGTPLSFVVWLPIDGSVVYTFLVSCKPYPKFTEQGAELLGTYCESCWSKAGSTLPLLQLSPLPLLQLPLLPRPLASLAHGRSWTPAIGMRNARICNKLSIVWLRKVTQKAKGAGLADAPGTCCCCKNAGACTCPLTDLRMIAPVPSTRCGASAWYRAAAEPEGGMMRGNAFVQHTK